MSTLHTAIPSSGSDGARAIAIDAQIAADRRQANRRHWDYPLATNARKVARKGRIVSAEDYYWMILHAQGQAEDRQKRQDAEAFYNDPKNIIYT